MFHKSSLLMTALVLAMGLAWFGIEHFGLANGEEAETGIAEATPATADDIRFQASAADHAVKPGK